jgi:uracil-DNA glycosylase
VSSLRGLGRGDVPYVAPMYGGIQARLLTVLTSPGTATHAAPRGTGFLCIENPDPAAANVKSLLEHAGIRPVDMVPWNACPWFTREQKPTAAELEAGVDPWLRLMALLPALRVIMLLGSAAQKGWRRVLRRRPDLASCPDITIINTYSPGPGALRHPDPSVREARQQDIRDSFRQAGAAIR